MAESIGRRQRSEAMEVTTVLTKKAICENKIAELLRDLQDDIGLNVISIRGKNCAADWEWNSNGIKVGYSQLDFPNRRVKIEIGMP